MNHGDYLVDLLNKSGEVIGAKPRRDIDKEQDLYHVVFIFIVTRRDEIVLGVIPERHDLPNVYARQMGATVATIRRQGETASEAATRALLAEVAMSATPQLVGEKMATFADDRRSYISVYVVQGELPEKYSEQDIAAPYIMPREMLNALVDEQSPEIAPTLQYMWQTFGAMIVV